MEATQNNVTNARNWLLNMGNAAKSLDLTIQVKEEQREEREGKGRQGRGRERVQGEGIRFVNLHPRLLFSIACHCRFTNCNLSRSLLSLRAESIRTVSK